MWRKIVSPLSAAGKKIVCIFPVFFSPLFFFVSLRALARSKSYETKINNGSQKGQELHRPLDLVKFFSLLLRPGHHQIYLRMTKTNRDRLTVEGKVLCMQHCGVSPLSVSIRLGQFLWQTARRHAR